MHRGEAIFPRLAGIGGFYSPRCNTTRIMEPEQLQNFNERLSQWVANQGFWFQVRYSVSGAGMKGQAMFHLLRLGFRLLIFLLVVAVGTWIYLEKRTDAPHYADSLQEDLQTGLSASEAELRGFLRSQGKLEISRLAAQGGGETFFTTLEARNIRCKMGLLDGLVGKWEPGMISISRLDLDLRAGTDDAESARKLADSLFKKSARVNVNALEVADATLRWGYSERTQGMIESSSLKMQRTDTGWRMLFKGGWFHQNWLRKLEIVSLVVVCEPDGLVFEKAELKQGQGTVDFTGLRVIGGERPQVKGVARIHNLVLENILPPSMRTFVEGSISGDFKVSGSTNTSDGIGFEGQVLLDGKDVITLRERIHLLKALSVVDGVRNYKRIDFREGMFQVKTIRGGMELSEVKLKAEDLFTLEGKMNVRLPTQQEIDQAIAQGAGMENSPLYADDEGTSQDRDAPKEKIDFTLKRAAEAERRVKDGRPGIDTLSLFDRLGLSIDMRRLKNQASERMSRMLRYEGGFRISIPGDAFDGSSRLKTLYPVSAESGRLVLQVPIEGYLYELTLKQAEELYQQGQR